MSRSRNPQIVKAFTPFEFSPEQQAELLRCAEDPVYFIKTYIRIQHPTRGSVPFELYPYQEDLIRSIHENRQLIVTISRQAGKLLSNDELLATPHGFTRMGDVQVGDLVIGDDGRPTSVVAVSEEQHVPAYRITFDDGTSVVACDDHQWTVHNRHRGHTSSVMTTAQLAQSAWKRANARGYDEYAYYIPNTAPVQFAPRDIENDPYLLGLWLGDGNSERPVLTCATEHKAFYESQGVVFDDAPSYESNPNVHTQKFNLNWEECKRLGLRKTTTGQSNKHIPESYLYNSVSNRIALLQGLMDADGFISDRNGTAHIQLTRKTPRLIDDVNTLLTSLGLKVTRTVHEGTNSVRLSFSCPRSKFDLFRIPHKLERQPTTLRRERYVMSRTIQNIERVEHITGRCIQVDNASNMYLCTKNFIPTHNTTCLAAYALWYACFMDDVTVLIVSNKNSNAMEFIHRAKYAYESLPNWIKPGVDPELWTKHDIGFDNKSRILSQATTESSGRGLSISLLIADELAHVKPRIVEEFWTSISPTLSTGGKCAISSTPNGDTDLFSTLWRGAEAGINGFVPRFYDCRHVPHITDEFLAQERAKIGETRVRQEYFCHFISSEELLVDSVALSHIDEDLKKNVPVLSSKNNIVFFEPIQEQGATYIVGVDPSKGVGRDFSAIQVWRVDSKIYQVAEFRSNEMVTGQLYATLKTLLTKLDNNMKNLVFFGIENNGVGEGMITLYKNDPGIMALGGATLVNDKNQMGMNTTSQNKTRSCLTLKDLIEGGRLVIKSHDYVRELKTYVRHKSSYAAQHGGTDDLIAASLLCARILKEHVSTYNTDAFNALYVYGDGPSDDDLVYLPSFL